MRQVANQLSDEQERGTKDVQSTANTFGPKDPRSSRHRQEVVYGNNNPTQPTLAATNPEPTTSRKGPSPTQGANCD